MNESTPTGLLLFGGNEMEVYSTVEDPSAYRGGATHGRGLFKLSGNRLVLDAQGRIIQRQEKTLLQGKIDEDTGHGGWLLSGQLAGTEDDDHMIDIAWFGPDGIKFLVPVSYVAGQAPTPSPSPEPPTPTPIPTPPPAGAVHGISPGDFVRIRQVYGFDCDEQHLWPVGKTWAQIIERQDVRDDFKHFPRGTP